MTGGVGRVDLGLYHVLKLTEGVTAVTLLLIRVMLRVDHCLYHILLLIRVM